MCARETVFDNSVAIISCPPGCGEPHLWHSLGAETQRRGERREMLDRLSLRLRVSNSSIYNGLTRHNPAPPGSGEWQRRVLRLRPSAGTVRRDCLPTEGFGFFFRATPSVMIARYFCVVLGTARQRCPLLVDGRVAFAQFCQCLLRELMCGMLGRDLFSQ